MTNNPDRFKFTQRQKKLMKKNYKSNYEKLLARQQERDRQNLISKARKRKLEVKYLDDLEREELKTQITTTKLRSYNEQN